MSAPTHILMGTEPEDDKHLSYASRRTHTKVYFISSGELLCLVCVAASQSSTVYLS